MDVHHDAQQSGSRYYVHLLSAGWFGSGDAEKISTMEALHDYASIGTDFFFFF